MPDLIRPKWEDLREVVSSAGERLIVCSPFYSVEGVGRVFDDRNESASLQFWTRLSPADWAGGFSYPDQLLALLEVLDTGGVEMMLGISQRLHAKAYTADRVLALVGSANLSAGGFGSNLEVMVRFRNEEAASAIDTLESIATPDLRTITLEQLHAWVRASEPAIAEARSATVQEPEILASVQAGLDEMLSYGGAESREITEPTYSDMETFVDWLERHEALSGSVALYRQHYNLDGNNRGGHFKQCFFASMRFFSEHYDLREVVSDQLNYLAPDEIYQMDVPASINELWREHLNAHATDYGADYEYPILRNILPPSVGGTRSGGGGGIGTIKRMLPLVARFIVENER